MFLALFLGVGWYLDSQSPTTSSENVKQVISANQQLEITGHQPLIDTGQIVQFDNSSPFSPQIAVALVVQGQEVTPLRRQITAGAVSEFCRINFNFGYAHRFTRNGRHQGGFPGEKWSS